ncbi:low molecular weight phosphatase family protein [Paracoccaceae bacterium GXU_MW_L88]
MGPGAVLFCCDHNAVRSPMAEGICKKLLGRSVYVQSAGVRHDLEIDGFAVAVCREMNIELERHRSRSLEEMEEWGDQIESFDLIIALSPAAMRHAQEYARNAHIDVEYWPVMDPTGLGERREEKMAAYRNCRDDLYARIQSRFGLAV